MDRRAFLRISAAGSAGVIGAALTAPAFASAAPTTRTAPAPSPALSTAEDQQLDDILAALETLPDDLKNADPATTPNYRERLDAELGDLTVVQTHNTGLYPQFDWFGCTVAVAQVIFQYGIPVAKVVKWIKEARALWGGFSGIIRAIQSGAAAAEIGEEGVQVLEAILGIDGVVAACLS